VRSEANTVEAYIGEQPDRWRPTLVRLREECVARLPEHAEKMRNGMAGYERDGVVEVGFALQRRHLSLYILNQRALVGERSRLAGVSVGKGTVRFARPDQVDFDVVAAMLDASSGGGEICP
jgi:uncharacterized protein YdhG (YjbR/CyaY superfamily)